MGKIATKASNNEYYIARYEASKFNDDLSSREGASEVLGIDRTRLARIELGTLCPYPEEVVMMSDLYNSPELVYGFCANDCPIGKKTHLNFEKMGMERATMNLLSYLSVLWDYKWNLVEIAKDGEISEEEMTEMERIMGLLQEGKNSICALSSSVEKLVNEARRGRVEK